MNKWENSVKRKIEANSKDDSCFCNNDQGLFVPNRQLSIVIAGLLFLFFTFFLTGYFLGKRYTINQFVEKMHNEEFSDQVYASIINSNISQKNTVAQSIDILDTEINQVSVSQETDCKKNEIEVVVGDSEINKIHYFAQLIGFGTEKAAEKFVQKLALKGVDSTIKKHMSKTAKGRTSQWYQVVTLPYSDKNELVVVVNRLTKEEMLKGVQISTC